jgi:hypothetical protein
MASSLPGDNIHPLISILNNGAQDILSVPLLQNHPAHSWSSNFLQVDFHTLAQMPLSLFILHEKLLFKITN